MRHRFILPTTLAAALALTGACGDDVTDPDALLESAEAEAVMRSAEALPMLPELLDGAAVGEPRDQAILVRARELWAAGVAPGGSRSEARRRLAIAYALPVLVESLPPGEWIRVRQRTDDWLATAESMLRHLSMPAVERRLSQAREQLRSADVSATHQDRVYHLLLAGSTLVETTPRYVARVMAEEAEAAIRRAGALAVEVQDEPALERADRLKDWAARAVEEGEYLLAIQRAYYAIQLAEGR